MSPRLDRVLKSSKGLGILAILVALHSCQQHQQNGEPESYIVNGELWAYGSVQLTNMDVPGGVMVRRLPPDQSVDTSPVYELYGAIQARVEGGSGERDIAFVDWHPGGNRLLVYAWQVDYVVREGNPNQVEFHALLKKPGPNRINLQRVLLGSSQFQNGADLAPLTPAVGLKLSLIANGIFTGQWALHYADAPMVVTTPWQGICPKDIIVQMPGQNPYQNPVQFGQCRPAPAQQDFCGGDPTQAGCRPLSPVQQIPQMPVVGVGTPGGAPMSPGRPLYNIGDLEVLSEDERVYALPAEIQEAKLVFISEALTAASEEENAELCARRFYAVGRTVGRQVNSACILKPAPATMQDGKLACGLTIAFADAQTYLEKVCDITAIFRAAGDAAPEAQVVQVLKR